jgi:hypothetical protein
MYEHLHSISFDQQADDTSTRIAVQTALSKRSSIKNSCSPAQSTLFAY